MALCLRVCLDPTMLEERLSSSPFKFNSLRTRLAGSRGCIVGHCTLSTHAPSTVPIPQYRLIVSSQGNRGTGCQPTSWCWHYIYFIIINSSIIKFFNPMVSARSPTSSAPTSSSTSFWSLPTPPQVHHLRRTTIPQTIACIWLRLRKLHHLHCAGTHHDCLYSFHIHIPIFYRFGALHLM